MKRLSNLCEMFVKCLQDVCGQEESEKLKHQTTERGQGVGLETGEDCWFRGQVLLTTYYRKC